MLHTLATSGPSRLYRERRPTWRVLLDLELALQQSDESEAERFLVELSSAHALGEPNLSFLQIQIYARFHRWDQIASLEKLPWVCRVRRPARVSSAIIEALFRTRLSSLLATDPPAVVPEVRQIQAEYAGLFTADPIPLTSGTAITTALVASVTEPPRLKQIERVLAGAEEGGIELRDVLFTVLGKEKLDSQLEQPTVAPVADPLIEARQAMVAGDLSGALQLAESSPPSVERTWLLFQVAVTVQTLEASRAALAAYDGLNEEQRAKLSAPYWDQLLEGVLDLGDAASGLPSDWTTWIERLRDDPSFVSAREVAKKGAVEWSGDEYGDAAIQHISDVVLDIPDASSRLLVQSVPHLLEAFPTDRARKAHIPLYMGMLQHLAFDDAPSGQELAVALDLVEAMLRLGTVREQYGDLIDLCRELWSTCASPAYVDWAVDMGHLLAYYPSQNHAATQSVFVVVVERIEGWPQLWNEVLLSSLRHISDVLEVPLGSAYESWASEEEFDGPDPWAALGNKTVGIYTLTESAAAQASKVLSKLSPECKVESNSDHVCTERLAALSANSDVFVLVTRSATHAASDCVKANRKAAPVLMPDGKGVTTIVRTIEEYLKSQASVA